MEAPGAEAFSRGRSRGARCCRPGSRLSSWPRDPISHHPRPSPTPARGSRARPPAAVSSHSPEMRPGPSPTLRSWEPLCVHRSVLKPLRFLRVRPPSPWLMTPRPAPDCPLLLPKPPPSRAPALVLSGSVHPKAAPSAQPGPGLRLLRPLLLPLFPGQPRGLTTLLPGAHTLPTSGGTRNPTAAPRPDHCRGPAGSPRRAAA